MAIVSFLSVLLLLSPYHVYCVVGEDIRTGDVTERGARNGKNKEKNKKVKFSDIVEAEEKLISYVDESVSDIQVRLDNDREVTNDRITREIDEIGTKIEAHYVNSKKERENIDDGLKAFMVEMSEVTEAAADDRSAIRKSIMEVMSASFRRDMELKMRHYESDVSEDAILEKVYAHVDAELKNVHADVTSIDVKFKGEIEALKKTVWDSEVRFDKFSQDLVDKFHANANTNWEEMSKALKESTHKLEDKILRVQADAKSEADALWKLADNNKMLMHQNEEAISDIRHSHKKLEAHVRDVHTATLDNAKEIEDVQLAAKKGHELTKDLGNKVQDAMAGKKQMEHDINNNFLKIKEAMEETSSFYDVIKDLRHDAANTRVELHSVVEDLKDVKGMFSHIYDFEKKMTAMRTFIDDNKEMIHRVAKQTDSFREVIKKLEAEGNMYEHEIVENTDFIHRISKDADRYKDAISSLKAQAGENESALGEMKTRFMAVWDHQEALEAAIHENSQVLKDSLARITDGEVSAADLRKLVDAHTSDLKDHMKRISHNGDLVDSLAGAVSEHADKLSSNLEAIVANKAMVRTLKAAVSENQVRLNKNLEAIKENRNQVDENINQIDSQLGVVVSHLRMQNDELEQAVALEKERNAELAKEIEQLKRESLDRHIDNAQAIEALKDQVRDLVSMMREG